MTLTRKDAAATGLTALIVVVFLATHEGWNVWLIGDSTRWAAVVITGLGMATCGLGSPSKGKASRFLGLLGFTAFVLSIVSIVTGSLMALSLLVVADVLLWAFSTLRHVAEHHPPARPIAT